MTQPLRILHTESSIGWGGQEIRILTEARGMLDRGHQVTLLTAETAQIGPAAKRLGIPLVTLPIEKKRVAALCALRRWLAAHAHEFDVINTHSSTDSWLTALARRTLRRVPPIVRTRHVSTPVHDKRATRWLYLKATTHIVTTGEAVRLQLHRDNRFPLARMTSVRTGIDLQRFTPRDRHAARRELGINDQPTLGILATLRDWKGHDYLLEAFQQLLPRFPQWQLLIVGDGPRRAHLQHRVAELGLADRVHMVGNRDDAERWLVAMDLFVLPSYGDEGVPQGIMQAMACGVPAISTPVGAIGEAVIDGVNGLMTEPRNSAALAQTLATLMGDDARRARMGGVALEYAQKNFGIGQMLDQMEQIFRRACAASR